jgi:hypothetical protein
VKNRRGFAVSGIDVSVELVAVKPIGALASICSFDTPGTLFSSSMADVCQVQFSEPNIATSDLDGVARFTNFSVLSGPAGVYVFRFRCRVCSLPSVIVTFCCLLFVWLWFFSSSFSSLISLLFSLRKIAC